ncbi:MAG: bifunctional adenosylcobinamide kinase/adenosylcobinamide-phosphate guanylyltransferase [Oscillospiraceae bacterium]
MTALVIGASASGKSEYAEALALKFGLPRYYIATMQPFGEEGEKRILRHRLMREGKGFFTIERYLDIGALKLPQRGTALLECVGNLVANELFSSGGSRENTVESIIGGISALEKQCENLIIVTNDIFSDGIEYDSETESYIKALGLVNSKTACICNLAVEIVCGIPIAVKGVLP